MKTFTDQIIILGINPCLNVPHKILEDLFRDAGKTRGPIPVRGTLNGKPFKQTVVKYRGEWRLYLNGDMRQRAGIDVGDRARVKIEFDPEPRPTPMPPAFARALDANGAARAAFEKLVPSRKKEILRTLASMKTEATLNRNIEQVVAFLAGKRLRHIPVFLRPRG